MKNSKIILSILIVFFFGVAFYLYPQMPDTMASHWNERGEVDGYMSKFWGVFLMPIISVFMLLLFLIIPSIDPLKDNVAKFRRFFDDFVILLNAFLFYIYLLTIFWSLGARFDMGQYIAPAIGILFYYAGVLTEHAKMNWFIGVRTPWTLSSEAVWDKTNQRAGKLFKLAAVSAVLGVFFKNYTFYFVIIPVLLLTIYVVIYSYIEHKKETTQPNP